MSFLRAQPIEIIIKSNIYEREEKNWVFQEFQRTLKKILLKPSVILEKCD